jgi:hypothetical protein
VIDRSSYRLNVLSGIYSFCVEAHRLARHREQILRELNRSLDVHSIEELMNARPFPELFQHNLPACLFDGLVGDTGFEPVTPAV